MKTRGSTEVEPYQKIMWMEDFEKKYWIEEESITD
jgi:hypothetical protein